MDKLNMNTVTVQCGFDYATVEDRVRAFCSEYQNGQILTEMVKCEDDTGEVIFKAHAVVDGLIRGTGHAMEVRGSSNINKTSHIECAETSAVGRALAFIGYMSKGQISSYEEVENAKLQQSKIKEHEKMFATTVAVLSTKLQQAIDDDNDESILECFKDMFGNMSLRQAVNKTLTSAQIDYLVERQEKLTEAKNIKAEEKIARNLFYAKEFVEKLKAKKKLNG